MTTVLLLLVLMLVVLILLGVVVNSLWVWGLTQELHALIQREDAQAWEPSPDEPIESSTEVRRHVVAPPGRVVLCLMDETGTVEHSRITQRGSSFPLDLTRPHGRQAPVRYLLQHEKDGIGVYHALP